MTPGTVLPGEKALHFGALLPILFANVAAFPFFGGVVGYFAIAALSLLALTVRVYEPLVGRLPRLVLSVGVLAWLAERSVEAFQFQGAKNLVLAQCLALSSLFFYMLPPGRSPTFLAAILSLLTLVTAGLLRNDLTYTVSLWGFLLTAPPMFTLSFLHESIRCHRVPYRRRTLGLRELLASGLRHLGSLAVTVSVGVLLSLILPKPALLPLQRLNFTAVSNTLMDRFQVAGGPLPRGSDPFLEMEGPIAPHLVGQIFDRYDRRGWSRDVRDDRPRRSRDGRFDLPPCLDQRALEAGARRPGPVAAAAREPAPDPEGAVTLEIRPLKELPDLLLLPEGTVTLEIGSWHLLGKPPYYLQHFPPGTKKAYRARVRPAPRLDELGPPHGTGDIPRPDRADSRLPDTIDPRIVELARRIAGDAPDAAGKVRALVDELARRCVYSTRTSEDSGEEAVTRFLFESRKGYCEHFASALALLVRAVGVPSRLVLGYLPVSTRSAGGRVVTRIRPRDAHAWVHVYLEGHGWVPVDPTENARDDGYLDVFEDWLLGDPLNTSEDSGWDLEGIRSVMATTRRTRELMTRYGPELAALAALSGLVGLGIFAIRRRRGPPAPVDAPRRDPASPGAATPGSPDSDPAAGSRIPGASDGPASGAGSGGGDPAHRRIGGAGADPGEPPGRAARWRELSERFDSVLEIAGGGRRSRRLASQTPLESVRALRAEGTLATGLLDRLERLARDLDRLAFARLPPAGLAGRVEGELTDLEGEEPFAADHARQD